MMQRQLAWLMAAAGLVIFLQLGQVRLWDEDEPKNAVCGREMLERGDWIVPTFNGQLRTDKPILLYWLMLSAYGVFGVCEFAARLPSAVLGMGTVVLTYDIGRRLAGERAGFCSGLVLIGSMLFGVASRAATPDGTLLFCTTLAFWAFVRGRTWSGAAPAELWPRGSAGTSSSRHVAQQSETNGLAWCGLYVALGLAVLAKGPAGVILPLGVLGTFTLWSHGRETRWNGMLAWGATTLRTTLKSLRPVRGLALTLLIAAPWYAVVAWKTDGAWVAGFLGRHNIDRFLQPLEGHRGPFFYYIPAILAGMLPWSVCLPGATLALVQRFRQRSVTDVDRFLLAWIGVYVVFFSLARTKLPSYVLPAYPALALFIGLWLEAVVSHKTAPKEFTAHGVTRKDAARALYWMAGFAVALAVVLGVALPIVAHLVVPGMEWWGLLALIPATGGAAVWHFTRGGQWRQAATAYAGMAVVLAAGVFGMAAVQVSQSQSSPLFAETVRSDSTAPSVGTLDAFQPSLVFYTGQTVADLPDPKQAAAYLQSNPQAFLVTREEHWPALERLLDREFTVLERRPLFLREVNLLLIGRGPVRERVQVAKQDD